MKFVSKFDDYKHEIHPGAEEYRQGAGNVAIAVKTAPHLVAEFTRGVLTAAEREACRQAFDGRGSSMFAGEQPGAQRHDGVFGIGAEGSIMGDADDAFYTGSKWEFMYSVFDTADLTKCPPAYRDAFEAVLTGDADACKRVSEKHNYLGQWALNPTTDLRAGDLINLDKLMENTIAIDTPNGVVVTTQGAMPAAPRWEVSFPWPSYDEMPNHPQLAKKIVDTADLIGVDKAKVAAYEIEHKARPSVIAALSGITMAEAKLLIDAFRNAPTKLDEGPVVAPPATRILTGDELAPNQFTHLPSEALTEGIRFGDFVQPDRA